MKRWTSLFAAVALAPLAGCSGGGVSECVNVTTGVSAQYVVDTLTVPAMRADFAMDLNGDGKADNQLGNIIGALTAQNLDTQAGVNTSLMEGSLILLFGASANSLDASDCASVEAAVGKSMMNPDFTGAGTFMKDPAVGGGTFRGKITSGAFNSNSPVTTATPTELTIALPLAGSTPVKLKITGAHLQYTKVGDKLSKGQLNGAIRSSDVQSEIIPTVAKLLSDRIAMDPTGSTNMQVLSIFDTGGNDDGCMGGCNNSMNAQPGEAACGIKGDKKIQTCEVSTNSIIKNVLAPDVQLFQGGAYKPNKDNTTKDSLSLGLGFTAVKGSF
jgi:hypothetical protein